MNLNAVETIIFGIATIAALYLMILHIVGDIQTVIRRYKDSEPKRIGKRDRYRPSLSILVYHNNQDTDISHCLDSLVANPYRYERIMVMDMTNNRSAQNKVAGYRRLHPDIPIDYRSFANDATHRQQTGAIRSKLTSKLTLIIDSRTALQSNSLLPTIRIFRDSQITSVAPQVNILPDSSLINSLFAIRQALINNFSRAFSNAGLFVQRSAHPALLIRTRKLQKIIALNRQKLPLNMEQYCQLNLYTQKSRLIRSVDLQVWVRDKVYRMYSVGFVFSVALFITAGGFIIYNLGLYNATPLIIAMWLVAIVFGLLSQPPIKNYSRIDTFSLALLAPFSLLTALVPITKNIFRRA